MTRMFIENCVSLIYICHFRLDSPDSNWEVFHRQNDAIEFARSRSTVSNEIVKPGNTRIHIHSLQIGEYLWIFYFCYD